jgi:asparagine synthase (glutamine-hydrolysing)
MKDYAHDTLLSANSHIHQYFNRATIQQLLKEHSSNKKDHHRVLWQLVVLEEWLQRQSAI